MPIGYTPPAVVDIGLHAEQLIGQELYGVDIKETEDGIFVVEVNDNPNIEHGIEDQAEKDQVWIELTRWFTDRLDSCTPAIAGRGRLSLPPAMAYEARPPGVRRIPRPVPSDP